MAEAPADKPNNAADTKILDAESLQPVQSKDAPAGAYGGILLCSLAVLMLEVLLTRIFSFTVWYHLAYLTISTALLGFGAAGSLLAAFPSLLSRRIRRLMALCSAGAGVSMLVSISVLAQFPLDPRQLLTDRAAFFVGLLGYYAAVTFPFLLAGIAISAPLAVYSRQVNRLYGADLLGAGFGCLGAVVALSWMEAQGALVVCAALFVAAGALYAVRGGLRTSLLLAALLLAGISPFVHHALKFQISERKNLGQARLQGTRELFHQWSPVSRVDLHGPIAPESIFWIRTGLNKEFGGPWPRALALEYDGHNGTNVLEAHTSTLEGLSFLDAHLLRTPYLLFDRPEVMVIGVGGGVDVMNALRRRARRVVGIELQPITVALHNGQLYTEGGGLAAMTAGHFQRPEVELHAAEGRHFIRSHDDLYDIIQITAVDTFAAQTTGAYVLAESYLYTVEAFDDYLEHLHDDGVISIVLGDMLFRDPSVPSPLGTRLVVGARETLERRGISQPERHIVMIAAPDIEDVPPDSPIVGGVSQCLLIKKTPFTDGDIERLDAFAEANGFAVQIAPGQTDGSDLPVYKLLHEPRPTLAAVLDEQPFQLEPVVDDRPFFYHVTRWSSFSGSPTLWYFPGSTVGLMMLVMMLAQSVLFGIVLIGLPLVRVGKGSLSWGQTGGFLLFFLGLGLGFLLIEISFVQKYVLLLGYPTYSLSVTIFSLLVFAGLGALLSRFGWGKPKPFLLVLLALTIAMVFLEIVALPPVRERLLAASLTTRILVTVLFQLPLGTCLGMYFPTGIELLRQREPALIPWAWAINGIASVASSVLAVILGMSIGFSAVAMLAAGIYAVGTISLLLVLRETPGAAVEPDTTAGQTA